MVVPPLGLPHVVPGRTRHAHQRGPARSALPGELERRRRDPARAQPGERIDRSHDAHVHLRRQAASRRSRATRSARRCSPPAGARSRAASSTTAAAACMCCAGQCPNCLVAVDGAPGRARVHRARARGHARRAPQRDARARARRDGASPTCSAGRSRRRASTTRRSSARGGCGRCTSGCCATPPGLGRLPEQPGRAQLADRVPPPPRRRARRRRRRTPGCARRSRPPSWAPTSCSSTRARAGRAAAVGGRPRAGARAGRAGARGRASRSSARRPALGHFDGLVPVWQGDTLHQIRARQHVFATGAIEQPLVFAGNDLPGVMLSERRPAAGARSTRSRPGTRAVVATTSDRGCSRRRRAARRRRRDRSPSPICDARRTRAAERLREQGVEVLHGWTIVGRAGAARGPQRDARAASTRAARERASSSATCVVVCGGEAPATSLVAQAGAPDRVRRGARALRARRAARRGSGRPASSRARARPGWRRSRASCAGLAAADALGLGDHGSTARRIELRRADRRLDARRASRPRRRRTAARRGQGVRLPLRGRHRQGHPPRRARRATTRSSCASASRR